MEKTSVYLADWQVLFREGIHFTLSGEEDLDVIGESTSNKEALEFITNNPPRIAILNVNHSEFSGVSLTCNIRQDFPQVSIILVMDTDDEDQLYSALKCGASACVTKDIDPDDLVRLIREIVGGTEPISHALLRPEIASRVIEDFENFSVINKQVDNLLANLVPREAEIMRHIASGNTIENITAALEISDEAVARSLDIIRMKLVANEHSRDIIEVAQTGVSSAISRSRGRAAEEYITKEEFDAFKESLRERFRSFTEG